MMFEIYVVVGVLMAGVYGFLLWLSRSYSGLNREVGELRQSVDQNTKATGGMETSLKEVKKDVDRVLDFLKGWMEK